MDPAVKSLLLALAESLDPGALGPLADRLEELGDARAEVMLGVMSRPIVRDVQQSWGPNGSPAYRAEPAEAPYHRLCREVLALFPDGPRWRLECRKRGTAWRFVAEFEIPRDAGAALAHRRGIQPRLLWRTRGPLWPTPAAG